MLAELRIRNLAVIDDVSVRLGPGLNVLSGETGAGKSIVVGALSLLLGERASSDVVRTGSERGAVEGVFLVEGRTDLEEWLEERGIEPDEGTVVLKREITVGGRNRAWINGSPTTAALLGELGSMLVSLHGQHQHQTLLRREEQRAILDAFGGHHAHLAEVSGAYRESARLGRELEELERRRRETLQRADFLRFQMNEIEDAGVVEGEDESLEDEARRLSHAEELLSLSNSLWQSIGGGADSAAVTLGSARRELDHLLRIDPSRSDLSELLDTAFYAAEELGNRLEAYGSQIEHDPARLDEIRRRQDLLYRLRSKYGPTLTDVLEAGAAAREELTLLDSAEVEAEDLVRRRARAGEALRAAATRLTELRVAASRRLSDEVTRLLPELGMDGGRFEIALLPLEAPGSIGFEEVEFLVSLNRGFEPRPLTNVASGGELSRVMLALKTILARLEAVPTLVFDEVDAGIGGRVALHVGDKMRDVAASHQVLAITHLPQIASLAHRHLLVKKEQRGDLAATVIAPLTGDERVAEVARMLGGDPESETSMAHARELIGRRDQPAALL